MYRCLFFFLLILVPAGAISQETTRIWLEKARTWEYNKDIRADVQRIIGDVVLRHDSAFLFCDSAYLNEEANTVFAYGNVHIRNSDTLNLYGDSLTYNGNTKEARIWSNVKLIDNQTILTTDTLIYNRNTQIAWYNYWGKIVNDKNILVSKHGYYYTEFKEFFFSHHVTLMNPDYDMFSDTLKYNTFSEVAWFFGPSYIISKDKEDSIWCTNGWYDTRHDICRFRERAEIFHADQYLTGDSMFYERKNGFGQVYRNAIIKDTTQDILLTGNFGELQRRKGFAFMTNRAVAIMAEQPDSLFMHADTVIATYDSAMHIRNIFSYFKVKFYRKDLQGMCDSLVYHGRDSSMTMYHDPVLWTDENQLTADSITLALRNGRIDTMALYNSAFIVSKDDSGKFNQIKGRDMAGYFRNNKLYKMNVFGNSETVYYVRDDDRSLIGILKALSSDMLFFVEENKLKSITYLEQPSGTVYPEKDFSAYDAQLKGFKWIEERRPRKKEDIFTW